MAWQRQDVIQSSQASHTAACQFPPKEDPKCIREWWFRLAGIYASCACCDSLLLQHVWHLFKVDDAARPSPDYTGNPDFDDPKKRDEGVSKNKEDTEFQRFRREVYHKVLAIIFESVCKRSHQGEGVKCGDGLARVLFPGLHILSLDGEEACAACACRSGQANYPCPQCLVPKEALHKITESFTLRTTESMRKVYENAKYAPNPTQREALLIEHGLHFTEVSSTFL